MQISKLRFFITAPHDCPYLPDRHAVDIIVDPEAPMNRDRLTGLFASGFRRSGIYVYRPECLGCQSCIAVRIPVSRLHMNRSQRRCARRNADLQIERVKPYYSDELFDLYIRYLKSRHAGGGMDDATPESFRGFLCTPRIDTEFLLFRERGRLLMVAVTDVLENGLSANYTFFDPDASQRSLGTYAILSQVAQAHWHKLAYVYLGYWIEASPKMRYKYHFRPLELYRDGVWRDWSAGQNNPLVKNE